VYGCCIKIKKTKIIEAGITCLRVFIILII
jgi:hypothetical protein